MYYFSSFFFSSPLILGTSTDDQQTKQRPSTMLTTWLSVCYSSTWNPHSSSLISSFTHFLLTNLRTVPRKRVSLHQTLVFSFHTDQVSVNDKLFSGTYEFIDAGQFHIPLLSSFIFFSSSSSSSSFTFLLLLSFSTSPHLFLVTMFDGSFPFLISFSSISFPSLTLFFISFFLSSILSFLASSSSLLVDRLKVTYVIPKLRKKVESSPWIQRDGGNRANGRI